MSNIIPMNYDDRSFPFTADCWFNATVAAKHHGKLPKDWLKTEATKFISPNWLRSLELLALA